MGCGSLNNVLMGSNGSKKGAEGFERAFPSCRRRACPGCHGYVNPK